VTVKAIETRYAGCRFRSRLEARWAVFFDTLGIAWEYEAQGYELPSGRYLPDFWLPACDTWIEVKGDPARVDVEQLREFAMHVPERPTQGGERGPRIMLLGPIPDVSKITYGDIGWRGWEADGRAERHGFGMWHKNDRPWCLERDDSLIPEVGDAGRGDYMELLVVYGEPLGEAMWRSIAEHCANTREPLRWSWDHYERSDAMPAYAAARSARFEHGECG
jgi:hypothetical protein